MPDMGYRDNVMGPQPIGKRKPIPETRKVMQDTVAQILDLLADRKKQRTDRDECRHGERRNCQTRFIGGKTRNL